MLRSIITIIYVCIPVAYIVLFVSVTERYILHKSTNPIPAIWSICFVLLNFTARYPLTSWQTWEKRGDFICWIAYAAYMYACKFMCFTKSCFPCDCLFFSFLTQCRPLSVSMGNAIKYLKLQITHTPPDMAEDQVNLHMWCLTCGVYSCIRLKKWQALSSCCVGLFSVLLLKAGGVVVVGN